jgi:hypothetical protein
VPNTSVAARSQDGDHQDLGSVARRATPLWHDEGDTSRPRRRTAVAPRSVSERPLVGIAEPRPMIGSRRLLPAATSVLDCGARASQTAATRAGSRLSEMAEPMTLATPSQARAVSTRAADEVELA